MRETTKKRHERIRQAAAHMYGKMPVMKLYVALVLTTVPSFVQLAKA